MKHVFGPVPSRRLGRSLGIDPVPLKTCNFSCVYCQLGRTRQLVKKRRAFFNASDIMAEVASTLDLQGADSIDWITFVGSGETTLYSRLGSLIRFVKTISELPVAVITNGSLLHLPEVRRELLEADAVLPSLDAGTEKLYVRINRPHHAFTFDHHIEGLRKFRKLFEGEMWVEVMLMGGINDSIEALEDLARVLERVSPEEIHISTPVRPPAEPWVELPDAAAVERALSILGSVSDVLEPIEVDVESEVDGEIADAVTAIVARHPLQEEELVRILARWVPGQVSETLNALAESGRIKPIQRYGKRFWCAGDTHFADQQLAGDAAASRREGAAAPVPHA